MYYRIKNSMDVQALLPELQKDKDTQLVGKRVEEIIERLSESYGDHRNSYAMGGYILFFTSQENYEKWHSHIMDFYRLGMEDYEYSEIVNENFVHDMEWWEELYLLGSDDALVMIHPKSLGGVRNG